MNIIDKIWYFFDHRKEFKNEFHNVDYARTRKQIIAIQAQLPILIEAVDNLRLELSSLNHETVDALKNFERDSSDDKPYRKLAQKFSNEIKPFCGKVFYKRKDVLETFSLFEHNHDKLIHDRADIDERIKALKVILDDKIFGRLQYLSTNNANFMNYEGVLILKQDADDLKHNLETVKNAMFHLKKEKEELWKHSIARINRREKVPDSERNF